MAKKITDENGNTYVQKKPFYKKVWFWILIVIIVIVGIVMAGGEEKPTAKNESSTEQTSKSTDSNKEKVFNKDQTIQYDGMDLKVEDVKYLGAKDEYDQLPKDKQYLAIKLKITNNNDEVLNFNPFDFKIVVDGKSKDFASEYLGRPEIDENNLDAGELKKGASTEGWITDKISKNAKKIQLEYTGNLFDDEAKFIINIKG